MDNMDMISKERIKEIDNLVRGLSDKKYSGYTFCLKLLVLERDHKITIEESICMAHVDSNRNWRVD